MPKDKQQYRTSAATWQRTKTSVKPFAELRKDYDDNKMARKAEGKVMQKPEGSLLTDEQYGELVEFSKKMGFETRDTRGAIVKKAESFGTPEGLCSLCGKAITPPTPLTRKICRYCAAKITYNKYLRHKTCGRKIDVKPLCLGCGIREATYNNGLCYTCEMLRRRNGFTTAEEVYNYRYIPPVEMHPVIGESFIRQKEWQKK